ncbi:unnamed protein product [Boreogadus saida]
MEADEKTLLGPQAHRYELQQPLKLELAAGALTQTDGEAGVEVENFVLKMAAEFPSRRDQLIFLINNYDMMLSVLMERAADDSKEVEGFQQLLLARTQVHQWHPGKWSLHPSTGSSCSLERH